MTFRRIVAVALLVLGVVSFVWGGISWTREETVVDFGPIEARAEERERIPLPPLLGGIALVGGIVLLVVERRRRI